MVFLYKYTYDRLCVDIDFRHNQKSCFLSLCLLLFPYLVLSYCRTLTLLNTFFMITFSLCLSISLSLSHLLSFTLFPNTYRRYELYHLRYVEDFSEAFFLGNRNQEWFRERYDPLKMHEQEVGNAVWAVKESAAVKKALIGTHLLSANDAV